VPQSRQIEPKLMVCRGVRKNIAWRWLGGATNA
jgi:hypothetical protein